MSRNNPTSKVLVATANSAVLAAGNRPSDLALGQIGFFDYETGLSVTTATKKFYIAVGVSPNGSATPEDIITSAGTHIQSSGILSALGEPYSAAQNKIVDFTFGQVKCDTTYGIKIRLHNSAIASQYGFNNPSMSFVVKSNCCTDDCESCPKGDCNEVALNLVREINKNTTGMFRADLLSYLMEGEEGVEELVKEVITEEEYEAWVEENPDACLGIRITGLTEGIKNYCTVNNMYDALRTTNLEVSLIEGFHCNGEVVTVQELKYETGSGYDIAQLEYKYAGHSGYGNYRLSELLGTPIGSAVTYANKSATYYTACIQYELESSGGWETYKNDLCTFVAIPSANTTAISSFVNTFNTVSGHTPVLTTT